MSVDFKSSVIFKSDRIGKDAMYSLNSNKIKKELNWKVKTNLEEGIKKTIKWVENNFLKLEKQKLFYEHRK